MRIPRQSHNLIGDYNGSYQYVHRRHPHDAGRQSRQQYHAEPQRTGTILVNGGAVAVKGGTPTVANTKKLQVFGQGGDDIITLDESNGALPSANLFGGAGNDTLIGGSGGDMLFGQSGNDTLLGKGAATFCSAALATTS